MGWDGRAWQNAQTTKSQGQIQVHAALQQQQCIYLHTYTTADMLSSAYRTAWSGLHEGLGTWTMTWTTGSGRDAGQNPVVDTGRGLGLATGSGMGWDTALLT